MLRRSLSKRKADTGAQDERGADQTKMFGIAIRPSSETRPRSPRVGVFSEVSLGKPGSFESSV
jgi:hypothetical protein